MKLPTLSSCCCGCSLRQGSIIVGVVYTAWQLAELILYSIYAQKELEYQKKNEDENNSYRALLIVGATVAAVLLLSNVILLYGVMKKRAGYMIPWLIIYTVMTLLSLVTLWIGVYILFAHANLIQATTTVSGSLLKLALTLYCILVIYSYYRQLQDRTSDDLPPLHHY